MRIKAWPLALVIGTAMAGELKPEASRLAGAKTLRDLPASVAPEFRCELQLLRAELASQEGKSSLVAESLEALGGLQCSRGVRLSALELEIRQSRDSGDTAREAEALRRWLELRDPEYRQAFAQAVEGKTSLYIQKMLKQEGELLADAHARLGHARELYLMFPQTRAGHAVAKESAASATAEELYGRARALAACGGLERAVDELGSLKKELDKGPLLYKTLLQLGQLEERLRHGESSEAALSRLIQLAGGQSPEGQQARYLLARTCYRRFDGRTGEALELLESLGSAEAKVREPAMQLRVGILIEKKRLDEAMTLLEAEGGRQGSQIRVWALDKLGSLRFSKKQWSQAAKAYEALLELGPEGEARAAGLYWLGRCREALGQGAKAAPLYAKAATEFAFHWYGIQSNRRWKAIGKKSSPPKPEGIALVASYQRSVLPAASAPKIEACLAAGWSRVGAWELEGVLAEEPDNLRAQYLLAKLHQDEQDVEQGVYLAGKAFGSLRYHGPDRVPAEVLRLLYPLAYGDELVRWSRKHGVSPHLAAGLILQESGFFAQVVSSAGAVGLMQLMPSTAENVAAELGLKRGVKDSLGEPSLNLRLGTSYLSGLLKRFQGRPELAIASYNAGTAKVRGWWKAAGSQQKDMALFVEGIPYSETRDYVKKVVGKSEAYRRLYPRLEDRAP